MNIALQRFFALLILCCFVEAALGEEELQVSTLTAVRCPIDDASEYSWLVFGPGGKPVDFVTNGNERSIFLPESDQWRIVICTADGKQFHKRIEGKASVDTGDDPVDVVEPKPKPTVQPAFIIVLRRAVTDEQKQAIAQLKDNYKNTATKVSDLHADNKDVRVKAWMKWVPSEDDLPYWFSIAVDGSILSQGTLSELDKLK